MSSVETIKQGDRRTWGFKQRDVAERARDMALLDASQDESTPTRPRAAVSGGQLIEGKTTAALAAKTGTGETGSPYVYATATVDLIDPSTGLRYSPNRTVTAKNGVNKAISANLWVGMVKQRDKYVIVVADCP